MIPSAAVFLLSCAAVAYEVLLLRWLHIAHDHPFAVMILSLALLGYGTGAIAVMLIQVRLLRQPTAFFAVGSLGLPCFSVPGCFGPSHSIPWKSYGTKDRRRGLRGLPPAERPLFLTGEKRKS